MSRLLYPPGFMRDIRSSILPIMCLWRLVLSYEHRHPMNAFSNPDEKERQLQVDTCFQASEIEHVSNLESPLQRAHLPAAAKPRLLLPCSHSVALSHPEVYKKMRVSWETWILPQFSLSPFFPLLFSISRHPVPGHIPPPLFLTPHPLPLFPSLPLFLVPPPTPPPVLSPSWIPSSDDVGSQYRGNPCTVSLSLCHLSFFSELLFFFMECRRISSIQGVKYPSLFAG